MTVLHPDDLARLTWSPGDVEIQHDFTTISGQVLVLDLASRAHDTASASARRTASEHARDAWHHEIRAPDGRWITGADRNDVLTKAATGRAARAVRLHDVVLYGKTELHPSGFGFQQRLVPMEVTGLHHHFEGSGKTPSGKSRRHRYTDMDLTDPETGEVHHESAKDGSSVKLYPREHVKAMGGSKPQAKTPVDGHADFWAKVNKTPPAPAPSPPSPVKIPVPVTGTVTGAKVHQQLGTPSLSSSQKAAFDAYTAPTPVTGYVNDYLHGNGKFNGQEDAARQQVAAMDSVFGQAKPTAAPMTLYRGMNNARVPAVGSTFTDSGYASTTSDPKIAAEFEKQGQKIVRVHVPAGSKAVSVANLVGEDASKPLAWDALGPVDPKTGDTAEREVLLPRASTFTVTASSGRYLDVKLTPSSAPAVPHVPAAAPEPEPSKPFTGKPLTGKDLWLSGEGITPDVTEAEARAAQAVWYNNTFSYTNDYLRHGTLPSVNSKNSIEAQIATGMGGADRARATLGLPRDASTDADYLKGIGTFKAMIARAPKFSRPAVMYRDVTGPDQVFGPAGSMKGRVFSDPGFMSATATADSAERYGGEDEPGAVPDKIIMHIPAGGGGMRSQPRFSKDNAREQEFTFAPGTRWRVDDDQIVNGKRQTTVTQIVPPGAKPGPTPPPFTPKTRVKQPWEGAGAGYLINEETGEYVRDAAGGFVPG